MVTKITLKSTKDLPFIITKLSLKNGKETKGQYQGIIYDDKIPGDRKTRINKGILDIIKEDNIHPLHVELHVWCLNEDVSLFTTQLLEKFYEITQYHIKLFEDWQILHEKRIEKITENTP
jgi:hypothetical protein